jgi:hypothetical protein
MAGWLKHCCEAAMNSYEQHEQQLMNSNEHAWSGQLDFLDGTVLGFTLLVVKQPGLTLH